MSLKRRTAALEARFMSVRAPAFIIRAIRAMMPVTAHADIGAVRSATAIKRLLASQSE